MTPEIDLRNKFLVELAYGSGLRRCELVRLNVPDIDITERMVRVTGKGKRERIVPVTTRAVELLQAYLDSRTDSPKTILFYSQQKGRMMAGSISKIIKDQVGVNAHHLRHAFASHLLQNGCDIRHIQGLLGHRKLDTIYWYTFVEKGSLTRTINNRRPRAKRS